MNQKVKFETAIIAGIYAFMIGLFVPIWWMVTACVYFVVVGACWIFSYYRAFETAVRIERIDLSIAVGNHRVLETFVGIEMVERVKEFVGNAYLIKIDDVIEFPMEDGSIVGIERALMILEQPWDDDFGWRDDGRVWMDGYEFKHPKLGEAQFQMVGMLPGTDVPVLVKRDEPRIDLNEIAKTLLPSIDEYKHFGILRYQQLKVGESAYGDERAEFIDKTLELAKDVLKERDGVKEPATVESVTLTHVGTVSGTTMPVFKDAVVPMKEPIEEIVKICDGYFAAWNENDKKKKENDPSMKI